MNEESQPAMQPIVTPESQPEQVAAPKPSKWRYFFIVLGILQAAGIALFFIVMVWAIQQANAGVSGTEYIAFFLLITVVPAVGLIALINLIGLPIYILRHKPRGKRLALAILSLSISVIPVLFGAYNAYQLQIAAPRHEQKFSDQLRRETEAEERQFEAANAKPEITKEEAIQLLQACKLKGFYYTDQADKSEPSNGGWGELSTTGVVLTKVGGVPYRISIADRLIPELVPIAREAQKSCPDLQFWHDGHYEQRQPDGTWH